jgi:hypothetical protein
MVSERGQNEAWLKFIEVEAARFSETWTAIGASQYGAASRRRRLARDVDLVILAPTDSAGGYFVMNATALPDALTFVVVRRGGKYVISNHIGFAPPVPGWPPAWWNSGDPVVDALPDS